MTAHVEIEAGAVAQEDVTASPPGHHPPEQVARHLVGRQPPLPPESAGDAVLSRVSELCGEGVAGPGVVGDLRGWGLAWPYGRKSGGEELAAEPGEHVGGAGLG